MFQFISKRLVFMLPILVVASLLIFFMMRIANPDPIAAVVGTRRLSDKSRAALAREFHLDKPLFKQYEIWINGMLRGEFPRSFKYREPVDILIAERLTTTLQLLLMSSIFAVGVSVGVGILCAIKRYTAVDRFFSSFLVFCASVPPFLVAIVFLLVFSMKLKWFPSFGVAGNFLQNFRYLTLPSIALGMGTITLMGRMTRDRMIDELQSNYALTEVAKGTPWRRIVLRHCFRNTVIPVLTIGSLELGKNIVDAVLVEKVFALGGIGELLIEGIKGADYPLVQCVVLLMVAIFLFINLSVDIVYALVDPRIRAINASSPNQL